MGLNIVSTAESQIQGIKDDGTAEGVVRSKMVEGELIKIPANAIDFTASFSGGASVLLSTSMFSNGDGSASSINMSTASGLGTNISTFKTIIYGRIVGIRFRKSPTAPAFSVIIDGVPYGIDTASLAPQFQNSTVAADREALYIISKDLPDIAHSVQVVLYPDASVAKTLVIYGFLGERRAGYKEIPKMDTPVTGTLTTSAVNVVSLDAGGFQVKALKAIIYTNTDTAAHTVTILYNGITVSILSIPAKSSVTFNTSILGVNLSGTTSSFQHSADAGSVVNFLQISGQ